MVRRFRCLFPLFPLGCTGCCCGVPTRGIAPRPPLALQGGIVSSVLVGDECLHIQGKAALSEAPGGGAV